MKWVQGAAMDTAVDALLLTALLAPGLSYEEGFQGFVDLSKEMMRGRNSQQQQQTVAGPAPAPCPSPTPACFGRCIGVSG